MKTFIPKTHSRPCLISIIVPTYNSEVHLGKCLESLRIQTLQDFEIVIVDGASKDGTLHLIQEQATVFPNLVWLSEKDKGVYDAMNKGLSLARGEWLLFLGSDDALYAPDVLAKMAEHFSRNYDFIYGNTFVASSSSWAAAGEIYDGEYNQEKILASNICHQSIFYSRQLFARHGGYNLDYRVLGDWEFNLRIFPTSKKKFVDLVVARFEGGGMSTSVTDKEFMLRFPQIVDRTFHLPFRATFYKRHVNALLDLAAYLWKGRQRLLSLRFFWIWLVNASVAQIDHQAREVWRHRRGSLRSSS